MKATTARKAAFIAGVVLFLTSALAGHLQARLLLWLAAGVLATPAVVHAFLFGLPGEHPRRPAEAVTDRDTRGSLPPSPRPRQLTS